MAYVVTNQTAEHVNNTNPTNLLQSIIMFFQMYWGWMLAGIVIIILVIVIFMLINKIEEERRERDEPGYQLYKTVKMACDMNKEERLIRTSVNWGLIWLWLIPIIGWILFFLIRKEHSAKVVDYQGNILGYYRGDYRSQDNTWNFMVYKEKFLFIFEQLFVIKVPLGFTIKKPRRDENGRIIYLDAEKKKMDLEEKHINLRDYIRKLPNDDIKIHCTNTEPIGLYYKCPVFIHEEKNEIMDYRKLMEGAIIDNTYELMTTRLLNIGARQMEKGMTFSPDLQFDKQRPQKSKEEKELDKYD